MIYIYEDEGHKNLLPLVYTRPVFELCTGNFTILERIQKLYPDQEIGLIVRNYLAPLTKEKYPEHQVHNSKLKGQKPEEKALFISGQAILEEKIPIEGEEEILVTRATSRSPLKSIGVRKPLLPVVGFRINTAKIKRLPIDTKIIARLRLKKKEVAAQLINYPWDLIMINSELLIKDFGVGQVKGILDPRAIIYGDLSRLYLEQNAQIQPVAVLNLHSGPIYIDRDAKICSLSLVEGPCYVGKNTIIDGAKIRPNCSFGDNCRIGGEVEASIFQGFANKHHEGFLGHSYVGEWVNLGALTTNSDLRNDYGPVKVTIGKKEIDTGIFKLGCFIGDHSKTAIGTLINTGAMIGIFANVFEPGLSAKIISSFRWGSKRRWQIEDVIKTAKAVMARRNILLTKSYENLLRYLYRKLSVRR
ncbi:MAG: putative sugar nucleotidyl transferase [candidate division WOR-3 bacterium]|nr:putative sugar nucleotidyl transferase [candidate division WOR-3 bacterium]MDH5683145.1 putative sugar nucleotidyl transferase [candidate division WOR-3 bacterium]